MSMEFVRTDRGWIQRTYIDCHFDGSPCFSRHGFPEEPVEEPIAWEVDPTLEVLLSSNEGVFTLEEIAFALRVEKATVRRLIKDGELPALKFRGTVRILRSDLLAFIEASRMKVGEEAEGE